MLLSIITVAFRNLEGIVKTHASLAHLAQADDISFEWIVVDGGSNDGTREYLENLNGIYNLRFVSEPDNGIYDAMNKGIAMATGDVVGILNSDDFYTSDEPPACDYCGYYSHSDRSLHINAALILSGKPQLIEEQVYTIFHELKHARQWAAVEGKLNDVKDYGYSDEQIRIWAENFDHYIPISVSDELYRKQPVESDAFGFETILKGERQFEII